MKHKKSKSYKDKAEGGTLKVDKQPNKKKQKHKTKIKRLIW